MLSIIVSGQSRNVTLAVALNSVLLVYKVLSKIPLPGVLHLMVSSLHDNNILKAAREAEIERERVDEEAFDDDDEDGFVTTQGKAAADMIIFAGLASLIIAHV